MEESIFDRPLEDQLCFEVYRAANGFGKMYNRALKDFHLTFPQYLVLLALWDEDNILIKHIGDRLGMGIGTLNPILNRLEKQGWLTKEPSLLDKRATIVSLSEKGVTSKKVIHLAILAEVNECDLEGVDGLFLMKQLKLLNNAMERTD
ncbi:MarR family winged helix-turn-helix transcriptional regulator [Trichococcus pasteurii]|uniref:HTH-type transcriptional regulator MgrA n=1 Tax=Trichococcus pasteurii TaxID=43064 RepID=A0A1W1ICU8_9LACT|nr:MarR family transcriptional regulator [Trichococcus pasteurii]SFE40917.1 DNA-binding transcriptional regulator, MarR family [Trichococcus pasteurii]SLM50731.1 transcriptional regulator marr-type conserved site [Trichococcus pasteurii]SSB91612.1 transcriptional regulator marr-type conserved site [Trichococcus pasteurii]